MTSVYLHILPIFISHDSFTASTRQSCLAQAKYYPHVAAVSCTQNNTPKKPIWVQNFIEQSAAVPEFMRYSVHNFTDKKTKLKTTVPSLPQTANTQTWLNNSRHKINCTWQYIITMDTLTDRPWHWRMARCWHRMVVGTSMRCSHAEVVVEMDSWVMVLQVPSVDDFVSSCSDTPLTTALVIAQSLATVYTFLHILHQDNTVN